MPLAPLKKKNAIVEIISLLLIFLFVYAAASKMLDYEKFRVQLGQSPMLTSFAGLVAWMVPSIEAIISVLLAIPGLRLTGLYASFSLMTMFTAYIIAITKFSEFVPCSCGGVLQSMSWNQHLFLNLIFVLLALAGILLHSTEQRNRVVVA